MGEPSIAMPEDARWKDLQLGLETAPIEVGEVRLESLELLVHLPWSWFAAAGGGMAFIKSVEYWLHSPGRVRAESARLRAEEAEQLAREMEAQARQLRALEDIEELRMARTPALRDATLKLP